MQSPHNDPRISSALNGETIYGDDFGPSEIEAWFRDEVDGYASLDHVDSRSDHYVYHAMDDAYAWRFVRGSKLHVLGLGSAYGSEFRPIAPRIESLTLVEPSQKFWRAEVAGGIPARYLLPEASGRLAMASDSFDLVTAFGVLHHVPNVSTVVAELVRVLKPGGQLAIREPITSMGDWRQPRRGLTARERGLPRGSVPALAARHGCQLTGAWSVGFGPLVKLATRKPTASPWNSAGFVRADRWLSRLFDLNYSYHRTRFLKRFAPTVGCWVLTKDSS